MECFQTVNYSIALMERIAESHKGGAAMTYAELVDVLERLSLLKRREAEKPRRLIRIRDLIAHEYYTISREELEEMAKLLPAVRALTK